jgi:CopG family transcriptional regulator/antitoxin EndoAI
MNEAKAYKRINVTLPSETLELIARVTPRGDRSRFVDAALHYYIQEVGRTRLRRELREGAIVRANRDQQIAEDWFSLTDNTWPPVKS